MKLRRLRQNIIVPTIELSLTTSKILKFCDSVYLRGFIGRNFPENIFLHNHDNDSLNYSYPRVQYKVIDSNAKIIGLLEGVDAVKQFPQFEKITIGQKEISVKKYLITEEQSSLGISDDQLPYTFLTPWLALNERNYERYIKFGTWTKKKELLEKILIGNIISMSKGLGYTVPSPIMVNIGKLKEVKTTLKSTPMLGFLGTFSVNFEIPDYWGIGKSVSRGFGTIIRT